MDASIDDAPCWQREPGLHVGVAGLRAPPPPTAHGVPLFVGIGERASWGRAVLALDRWEHFHALVRADANGLLAQAVRGFFLNGGKQCRLLPVPERDRLAAPFREHDGPLVDMVDADLVCVPEAAGARDVNDAVLDYCEAMGDRFAILDSPRGDTASVPWRRSRFGALYRPWLAVATGRAVAWVPPCGHVAGLYARTDGRLGPHRAPANEVLEGVLGLDAALDEREHARLNHAGVNCIVAAAGRGIRVMGARTLAGASAWQHVPVARLFIGLLRWLRGSLDDLIFESHTPQLWRDVERRIRAHCVDLMNAGALAGGEPATAFRVKCDAETNPSASREAGRLVAEVGLAPSIPAEFIVVRVVHDASGITVTSP